MIISHEGFPVGELEMLIDTDKRVIVLQNGHLYVTLEQSDKPWIDFYPDTKRSQNGSTVKGKFLRYLCDIWEIKGVTWTGPEVVKPTDITQIMQMASNWKYTPHSAEEFAALALAHGSELEIKSDDETGLQSKN